jgi:3-hydroxypropanoate dehydrogenase
MASLELSDRSRRDIATACVAVPIHPIIQGATPHEADDSASGPCVAQKLKVVPTPQQFWRDGPLDLAFAAFSAVNRMSRNRTLLQEPFHMRLDDKALAVLFKDARTQNTWQTKDVPDALLHELVDLTKMAPTSANCSPMRLVFVKSKAQKERLKPYLAPGNVDKTMSAPVTAIVAQDMDFYNHLPKLFPHADAKSWFVGKPEHIAATAFRNASMQGAYLIMASRALGLDSGAMSGFDAAKVDADFFAGTTYKANFLLNLGYGDPTGVFARSPRFAFDEIAKIV